MGKSSSSQLYENNVGGEGSNNIPKTENRNADKINKMLDRKTRKKRKKTLILGEPIVENLE